MKHTCHARECKTECPRAHLMCKRHWFMVPKEIRDRVWATYQPGQENLDDENAPIPSDAWHRAADDAINAVANKEAGGRL